MIRFDQSRTCVLTSARALFVALMTYSALQPAHAYIDPGTGAMMMQLAAAALAGVAFYFRSFRDWFWSLFRRTRGAAPSATSARDQSTGGQ